MKAVEIVDHFLGNAARDTVLEADECPVRFGFGKDGLVGAANDPIATK
ncbi:MAG TPA: hypothetical protein VMM76_01800 [Pirellulaceae bacterium]|nr:hypothetical protein [Pirellulaceae bacterium]